MKESQNPIELKRMKEYIKKNNVTSILEIGSRYGETLLEMAHETPVGSRIVSVELPEVQTGRKDSLSRLLDTIQVLDDEGYDAELILGDSKDPAIYERVKALAPFDFVFIDGDHSYSGVLSDWENYGPLGRHVGFHDVNAEVWETIQLWRRLKDDFPPSRMTEIIDKSMGWPQMGIGIINRARVT